MKITNTYLNENILINNKSLKDGSFFKAKVIEVNGENVIIVLDNGELLEAKTSINLENMENKLLTFLVTSIEDNKIFLSPTNQEELTISNNINYTTERKEELFINKVLDAYNLPKSDENIHVIKTIFGFKMSLSQENIINVIKSVDKLNNLKGMQQDDKVYIINSKKSPLYENVMKLIKVNTSTDIVRSTNTDELIHSNFAAGSKNNVDPISDTSDINFIDVTETIYPKLDTFFPEHTTSMNIINKVVFLMKLGLDISLGNFEKLMNLIDNDDGIIKPLFELLDYLKDHSQRDNEYTNEQVDILNKANFKLVKIDDKNTFNKESVKTFLNEMNSILEQIKPAISTKKNTAKDLNTKLNNFFESIELNNKINSYYTFIHVPIEFNKEKSNNNVYILKKKNKSKNNNYSLYISLNTKNLRKVDVFCNINHESIKLDFIVEKEFMSFFKKKFDDLTKSLNKLGYQNILIDFREDKENDLINMFIDGELLNYNLNVRV